MADAALARNRAFYDPLWRATPLVPPERFDTYRRAFGERFEAIEIDDKDSEPGPIEAHSVLTVKLQDRPGTPTKLAEERVIRFFQMRTGAAS